MTRMFSRLLFALIAVITVVGVVTAMTEGELPRDDGRLGIECTSLFADGVVCDPPASPSEPIGDDDPAAAHWKRARVSDASYKRCEPAPGFFLSEIGAEEVQSLESGKQATHASLVERIHVAGRRFGVAPHLGEGIAWTESRFDPTARSSDGLSYGAFQLTKGTADAMRRRLVGVTEDLPLHDEVTLGIGYLRYLSGLFARATVLDDRGNTTTAVEDCTERWRFAIAAYNAGEGRVAAGQRRAKAAGLDPTRFDNVRPYLPRITRRYVDSVLTFAASQLAARAFRAG